MAVGTITTGRGFDWTKAPQDLIAALNLTAKPLARIAERAVSDSELYAAAVLAIAATVPAPARNTFTVPVDIALAGRSATIIANLTPAGVVTTQFVVTNQTLTAQLDGYIPSANVLKLIARNFLTGTSTIPAGTVITYIVI